MANNIHPGVHSGISILNRLLMAKAQTLADGNARGKLHVALCSHFAPAIDHGSNVGKP